MFKRKKKKTGCETPTYSRFSMAPKPARPSKPNPNYVPPASVKPPKPPTSGSNAVKPNPNYVPPASVKKFCPYETPCGWCCKWDKKCDKKIGCEKPPRGLRAKANMYEDAIDFSYGKCFNCEYEVGCDKECNPENNFKYFQPKEHINDTSNTKTN